MQIKKIQTINGIIFLPFTVFPAKVNFPQVKKKLKSSIIKYHRKLKTER